MGHHGIQVACETYENKQLALHSPINRLKANHIFKMMMQTRDGLCMTANPMTFTSKIIPGYDPWVHLRQNSTNELEVACPLPISKINTLNPSIIESMQTATMTHLRNLPQANVAFEEEEIVQSAMGKVFRDPTDEEAEAGTYTYKIIAGAFSPAKNFAAYPVQVGKWFPGMYTVYADSMV